MQPLNDYLWRRYRHLDNPLLFPINALFQFQIEKTGIGIRSLRERLSTKSAALK